MVGLYHPERISYDSEVSKPQEVHLEKSELLDGRHVELSRDALVRRVKRHVIVKRKLGDNDAGSVRRSVARQPLEGHRKIEHLLYKRLILVSASEVRIDIKSLGYCDAELVRYGLGNLIALLVSGIERSGDISHGRLGLEGTEGDDLRDLVAPVLARDVVYDLLASLDAEVYIYIRHAHSLRIEESLEYEVVFDRVDLGDGKAVCDDAACGRASARSDCYAVTLCVVDEVPYDEEVLNIAHTLDDRKLRLEPLPVQAGLVHGLLAVAPDKALVAELS